MSAPAPHARVCDDLVVVFTPGMSLLQWETLGLLSREWALYDALLKHPQGVGRVIAVTFGDASDLGIGDRLRCGGDRVAVICNEHRLGSNEHIAEASRKLGVMIGRGARVIVKTNQMASGDVAVRIAQELRSSERRVALLARGGYLWSQFVAWEQGPGCSAAKHAGQVESRVCEAADMVVGTTRQMVDDLAWRHCVPESRACVVPNYVVDADAPTGEERAPGVILFAGRLVPQKRVDRLIDAVGSLREDLRERTTLSIVGSGPLEEQLRAQAAEAKVRVEFETRMPHDQLIERMRRCAVYAQTSAFEGHPKTVIEAMAVGAPVVVCDTPGMRGIVRHAITGLCVNADPDAIRMALEGLLDDKDWGETLGMAASAHARSTYALEHVLPQELASYARALENAAKRGVTIDPNVRWDASLLAGTTAQQLESWSRSLGAFASRLEPMARAKFLLALDAPLYAMQGQAAIDAEGGLHPKHRLMRYHDFFVDRITPEQRVLDLGCGVGALAASIAQRSGASVTGMDWAPKNLEKARAIADQRGLAHRLNYVLGDITKDRPDESGTERGESKKGDPRGADGAASRFDVVVLSNVLEHVTDRAALLRQWREWYRPSRFLIRVPAFDREWRVPFKKELGVEWRLDDTHEIEYTPEQLREELEKAGLKVTEWITRWGEFWVEAVA